MLSNLFKRIMPIVFCFTMYHTWAQERKNVHNDNHIFLLAKDAYQKGHYQQAYTLMSMYNLPFAGNAQMRFEQEKSYYYLASALMLDVSSVVPASITFIRASYHAPYNKMLAYVLGNYYFRDKKYKQAKNYYALTDIDYLTPTEVATLKFNKGYCHFMAQQFEEALPFFRELKDVPADINHAAANYYYGFIQLGKGDYAEALKAFMVIENNTTYATVIPYYIATAYYYDGQREKALDYALASLKKGGSYYSLELQQLVGHIYFEQKKYNDAVPYLEAYFAQKEKVSREELYELSFCYYMQNKWDKAIEGLKQISPIQDELGQNSIYLIANAFIHLKDKANAKNAFLFSSISNQNPLQKEVSTFLYAKLSEDLDFHTDAVATLKKFIQTYPSSTYIKEAKEILVASLAQSNNYKEALEVVETIDRSSELAQKAYTRILYGRALELLAINELSEAETLIDKIFQQKNNHQELQPAYFWKGEIAYRQKQYQEAITALKKYLQKPVTYGEVNEENALYTTGYAQMKLANYHASINTFNTVLQKTLPQSTLHREANVRLADVYFMTKQYAKAAAIYSRIVAQDNYYADYAFYQNAIIAGAHGKIDEKAILLQQFVQQYKSSSLLDEATIQLADAYMANENFEKAIAPLEQLLGRTSAESFYPQALLKLGIANFNLKKEEASLDIFAQLVKKYPNAEETEASLDYIKNIYVTHSNADGYIQFMQDNGLSITQVEIDSLSYAVVLETLQKEDKIAIKEALKKYIKKFPNGQEVVEASYQLAQIYDEEKDYSQSLLAYSRIVDKMPNKYAEEALLQMARIYYFQKQDYKEAINYFTALKNRTKNAEYKMEAMRGLLRSQYKLQEWKTALQNATELLEYQTIAVDDKQMSLMIVAKNKILQKVDENEVIALYKKVYLLGKSVYAAEARYQEAKLLLKQRKFEEAEKQAFNVINKSGSYEEWIARSYVLLAEIYYKQKDYFNAEATLKSVIENTPNKEVVKEATVLLRLVKMAQNKESKVF